MEGGEADVAVAVCRKGLYDTVLRHAAKVNVKTEVICERTLDITCQKGHPIIKNGKINYDLFGNYPAFTSIHAANTDVYAPYFLARHGIDVHNLITMDSNPVRYQLLRELNGYLVSMPVPETIKKRYDLESVSIKGSDISVFAAYHETMKDDSLVQEYIDYCKELA